MTLAEYLRLNDMTHEAFADKAGLKRPTVTRLVKPGARPSWKHIKAIQMATGGKVAPNDWVSMMQGAA